ncbi:HD domain-containing protein [Desarmillaria tabescens]|uniref:5'-deoxynucleotidase n=1 Tax=Armillaria tabescens TaxID=1929756 RepID=A0AA39N4S8_ARMTA|nr:HD domain-containing protein [Desarmillaria tabescens]KAK0457892.1 HD domain-containing protein [Desarmillaria tabescens]
MSSSTRVFPPLYTSSGDDSADRLAFFHILERLKTQKRTGWIDHGVRLSLSSQLENKLNFCDRLAGQRGRAPVLLNTVIPMLIFRLDPFSSISDHMYRMAVLAMCTSDEKLDIPKCVMMCIVHDLAEAQVGDITPREGISRAEKQRLEEEAMHNFIHEMLHNSPAAQRIEALWKEYEDGKTPEARFVKDLDRFELASQAFEYERTYTARNLQTFFDTSLPKVRHTEVREWGEDLMKERKELWKAIESEQPTFNSLL